MLQLHSLKLTFSPATGPSQNEIPRLQPLIFRVELLVSGSVFLWNPTNLSDVWYEGLNANSWGHRRLMTGNFDIQFFQNSISRTPWIYWLVVSFFFFIPTWGNDPIWRIFFRWVETTNQIYDSTPRSTTLKKKPQLFLRKDYIALTETFAEGLYTDACLQKSSSTINPDPLKDLHTVDGRNSALAEVGSLYYLQGWYIPGGNLRMFKCLNHQQKQDFTDPDTYNAIAGNIYLK